MKLATFKYEKIYWKKGYSIIGVDEVGRGCFAGPVAAGAAMLNGNKTASLIREILKLGITDSKRLSPEKRLKISSGIMKYFTVSVGISTVVEINRFGISKATTIAMRRAVKKILEQKMGNYFLFIDAFNLKNMKGIGLLRQLAIKDGDSVSISVAAASIVAKVYRDNLMIKLAKKYTDYCWDINKGYGTRSHQQAILKYGICDLHRKAFVDTWFSHHIIPTDKHPFPVIPTKRSARRDLPILSTHNS